MSYVITCFRELDHGDAYDTILMRYLSFGENQEPQLKIVKNEQVKDVGQKIDEVCRHLTPQTLKEVQKRYKPPPDAKPLDVLKLHAQALAESDGEALLHNLYLYGLKSEDTLASIYIKAKDEMCTRKKDEVIDLFIDDEECTYQPMVVTAVKMTAAIYGSTAIFPPLSFKIKDLEERKEVVRIILGVERGIVRSRGAFVNFLGSEEALDELLQP